VKFSVGSRTLTTVAVNASGVASFTASTAGVAVGYYPVIATYAGDGSDNGAASATVTVYVRPSGYSY
jgi:Bacterial Ig-like domain (group 3)